MHRSEDVNFSRGSVLYPNVFPLLDPKSGCREQAGDEVLERVAFSSKPIVHLGTEIAAIVHRALLACTFLLG